MWVLVACIFIQMWFVVLSSSRSLLAVWYITSALLTVYYCELVNSCYVSSKRQQYFIGKENSLCVLLASKLHRAMLPFPKILFLPWQGDGRESHAA